VTVLGRLTDVPYCYSFADLTIFSDTVLPGLVPPLSDSFLSAVQDTPLEVTLSNPLLRFPLPDRWSMRIGRRRRPWMCSGLTKHGYLLRFPGVGDFLLDPDGQMVQGRPDGRTTERRVAHVLLDHVLPLALSLRQKTVLHASAIVTPHGCCLFTGPSGSGKSTLAASFLADGADLLSDDGVVLTERNGTVWAISTYASLRLWADSLRQLAASRPAEPVRFGSSFKHSVLVAAGRSHRAYPVRRIYQLAALPDQSRGKNRSSAAILTTLSQREGLIHLLAALRRVNVVDPGGLIRELDALSRIVELVPVKQLTVPHRYDRLAEVREVVRQDLRGA
jgi:hypothetical protein